MPGEFERDPSDWLKKLSPHEWIRTAMGELKRAEEIYAAKNARGGLATARRAAGMALNGVLLVHPDESWGRSFMDHLLAVAKDETMTPRVRESAKILCETLMPGGEVVALRTASADRRVLEAARDIVAHGYAVVAHVPEEEDR